MKRILLFMLVALAVPNAFAGPIGLYQHGIVVRMHMGECMAAHHGFMTVMGGAGTQPAAAEECAEYTLVTDKVVYMVVGKSGNQLIPLAETIDFRFKDNQLMVRVDDDRREVKFNIKEMALRSDWDRVEHLHEAILSTRSAMNGPLAMEQVQEREH